MSKQEFQQINSTTFKSVVSDLGETQKTILALILAGIRDYSEIKNKTYYEENTIRKSVQKMSNIFNFRHIPIGRKRANNLRDLIIFVEQNKQEILNDPESRDLLRDALMRIPTIDNDSLGTFESISNKVSSESSSNNIAIASVQDWGDAPDVSNFYGRNEELKKLEQLIITDKCRLVSLLGMGGIGKTALAKKLAETIKDQFDYIIWRSLKYEPPIKDILADLLKFLSDNQESDLPSQVSDRISLLINYLRSSRCLLILDDWEMILESGQLAGNYRQEYEDYSELLRRIGESNHQSCLLLISQEKPKEIISLEGQNVYSLKLQGLKVEDVEKLLIANDILTCTNSLAQLCERYEGNPRLLQRISIYVKDFYRNNLDEFLEATKSSLYIPNDISDILHKQFERLTDLEKDIMYWLALEQQSVTIDQLKAQLWDFKGKGNTPYLNGLDSLKRKLLIEYQSDKIQLEPIIKKYVSNQFIKQFQEDALNLVKTRNLERLGLLKTHSLTKNIKVLNRIKNYLESQIVTNKTIPEHLKDVRLILQNMPQQVLGYILDNIELLLASQESC